ncbi:MAG: 5'-methylthioadenosine/adenosylhomocysteine nucleosidase [Clostridia bacterium]|nr:5'-methylthioadenosine/adenosylhomocysteine nucleosidase [Clostridia bacterium]
MNKQPIGVIGAMKVEIDTLIADLTSPKTETVGGLTFTSGELSGVPVVLSVSGVGKVCAAMAAQTMILRYGVRAVINTGVAGTLTDALSIGDIAVADSVVQHDMDTSAVGDPVGLISGLNIVYMKADGSLSTRIADIIKEQGVNTVSGVIASGDVFVADSEKKAYIRDTFGAVACEMEGGAIGQVCAMNGIPFAVIRAISDGGNEDAVMDFPTFVKIAAQKSADAVRALMETEK